MLIVSSLVWAVETGDVQRVAPEIPSAHSVPAGTYPCEVSIDVGADGVPTGAKVVNEACPPEFAAPAQDAALAWRFAPSPVGIGTVYGVVFEFVTVPGPGEVTSGDPLPRVDASQLRPLSLEMPPFGYLVALPPDGADGSCEVRATVDARRRITSVRPLSCDAQWADVMSGRVLGSRVRTRSDVPKGPFYVDWGLGFRKEPLR